MKKIVALFLAAVAAGSLVVGCSQKGALPGPAAGGSSAQVAASSSLPPASAAPPPSSSSLPPASTSLPEATDIVQPDGLLATRVAGSTTAELNLRKGPGTQYESLLLIPRGSAVEQVGYLSADRLWVFIEYDGQQGWADTEWLSFPGANAPAAPGNVQPDTWLEGGPILTTTAELNLRTGPSTKYEIILRIPQYTHVTELGYQAGNADWVYVEYAGMAGWVAVEWLSAEMGGMAKPVIYLYPTAPTNVEVSVRFENGGFTCTYPDYRDGWAVTAYPDGRLVNKADGREYSYLYWEGAGAIDFDFSSGFVVPGEDTAAFLQEKLAQLGLTPREYNEFIVYWLPLMQGNPYNLITFQTDCYTSNVHLDVSPQPDSLLRVYMVYKPLAAPINLPEQQLQPFERKGFAVVEWGGGMQAD